MSFDLLRLAPRPTADAEETRAKIANNNRILADAHTAAAHNVEPDDGRYACPVCSKRFAASFARGPHVRDKMDRRKAIATNAAHMLYFF